MIWFFRYICPANSTANFSIPENWIFLYQEKVGINFLSSWGTNCHATRYNSLLFVRYCQSFAREIDSGFLQIFQEPKTSQWYYFPHINEMRRFLFTQYTVILTLFSSSGISMEDFYLIF